MIFMKIMMTVGPEVIVNKEQWSYDECIFFSFLKHFLEFRFPVIVDFAVSLLSLFRNNTYNGNWFLGKPDSALKSHVLASTTSGPESYRVLKSKERHQNYLLE